MIEELKESDLLEEVGFEISKDAFKGPIRCCGRKAKRKAKTLSVRGLDVRYEVWACPKCRKEYLDTRQAERLEKLWTVQRLLEDKLISVERTVNFDGKTYFVRFPTDLTKRWKKGANADITVLGPDEFLIKIQT